MNMSNLAKMLGKLPVVLQIKWRDEALRIRERKGFPTLEDLVEFTERHLKQLMTQSSEGLGRRTNSSKEGTQEPLDNHYLQVFMRWPGPRQRWQIRIQILQC